MGVLFFLLDRRTKVIENCVESSSGSDKNRTVEFAYNGEGQVKEMTIVNSTTGAQTTEYDYGTTLSDSDVARADLLRAVVYPDGSASDRLEFSYNRLGEATQSTDTKRVCSWARPRRPRESDR